MLTVLWNQAVHTDREVTANRSDKIIKNKKEKTCTLIDVAIPAGRNVVQKEEESKLKYKEFMYRDKSNVEPDMYDCISNNWSHWFVMRSLRKNLEAVPGKHSIDSLQKTAILRTSHIIWKVLQCEAWSLSGGDHGWFKRSTRQKRPVTRDICIVYIYIYINTTTIMMMTTTTTTKSYPVSKLISTLCIFLCAALLLLDSFMVSKTAWGSVVSECLKKSKKAGIQCYYRVLTCCFARKTCHWLTDRNTRDFSCLRFN